MLKNEDAVRAMHTVDFESLDLGSLEDDTLDRMCFVLSKYDIHNPAFTQPLIDETMSRVVFPELPIWLTKLSCFSRDQLAVAFERACTPSNGGPLEFPSFVGVNYGLSVLKVLTPLQRNFASKVCRVMEETVDTCKNKVKSSTFRACIDEINRLELDTMEGASLKRVLEARISQRRKKRIT
jgi:hypothetical protein